MAHADFATMGKMATDYFKGIFSAYDNLNAAPVLDLLETIVSEDDNIKLCKPFTGKEIADALCQIGP